MIMKPEMKEKLLPQKEEDEEYMRLALEEARLAADAGEVPIGCVIVWEGKVAARAHNRRETRDDTPLSRTALAHAECEAITEACRALGGWRLHKAVLYVTVEPCPMCAGAIVNARIPRVVYGTKDSAAGAFGSVLNMNSYPLNHKPEVVKGVLEPECRALMQDFFTRLRESRNRRRE